MPRDANLAGVGPQQRCDRTHERGLPGAVRAQQRGDLTGFRDQLESVECANIAKTLHQTMRFNDRRHDSSFPKWVLSARHPQDEIGDENVTRSQLGAAISSSGTAPRSAGRG